jgi:hypothetical protein
MPNRNTRARRLSMAQHHTTVQTAEKRSARQEAYDAALAEAKRAKKSGALEKAMSDAGYVAVGPNPPKGQRRTAEQFRRMHRTEREEMAA